MGHGHVTSNPDGSKARCGGPAICSICSKEQASVGPAIASDENFKAMVENNIWHDNLGDLLRTVAFCVGGMKDFTWAWSRTPGYSCKYIDVRIDMRDGGFIVKDRDGKRISLEQLKEWGLKKGENTSL